MEDNDKEKKGKSYEWVVLLFTLLTASLLVFQMVQNVLETLQ